MVRLSFRQSMLAGFMLITLLLGGAAASSWLVVERFVEKSRRVGDRAIQVSESIHELGERTVDVERSARQFLILNESALRGRFDENLAQARSAVDHLDTLTSPNLTQYLERWRSVATELHDHVHHGEDKADILLLLASLAELNTVLGQESRRWIDDESTRLLDGIEKQRIVLTQQVMAAVVAALAVALAMGWWLARPIRSLEIGIARLGENRLDEPIVVRGPVDLRQVGRRLDWLRLRLSELEAEREQHLRHVSHELKTPLTALREGIALMRDQVLGRLGDDQREVVDILHHNVMTLQRQIESLLDLNAAAFAARRLKHQPVLIRQVITEAVRRRELQLQARGLRVNIEGNAGMVRVDEDKILVALDNLLSNAIDFSPDGEVIRVVIGLSGGKVSVDVIDAGPGVAEEDSERIFLPFVQGKTKAPIERQGSGVGLSIVRELLLAMDGSVSLMPSAKGACFRLEVPHER